MSKKAIGIPDSDETARHNDTPPEEVTEDAGELAGRQTSNKTGKHSSVEKLAASRPEFGRSPGARHVDGAFGDLEKDTETPAE